jgi:hypothetical protein
MVQWLGPTGLLITGLDVVLSGVFGRYADKRELEGAITREAPIRYLDPGDLWIDYISDSGDGWASTYAVAWLACQDHDVVDGGATVTTRPGHVLVLGGDQVYPSADYERYRRKLITPYSIASRQLPATGGPRDVLAIPGNHDWYDGLTSFMRIFGRSYSFGAWRAPQARSYFAAQLKQRWWLVAIDISFDQYLDAAQLGYFRDLKGTDETNIRPGDRIILCTAKPTWSERCLWGDYRTVQHSDSTLLADFEKEIVNDWGCELPLVLSGDLHHYSRYQGKDRERHMITAGGGGAFLLPTHGLAEELPCPDVPEPLGAADPEAFTLEKVFPSKPESRSLRSRVLVSPFYNPTFLVLIGGLDVVIASQARGGIGTANESIVQSLAGVSWATILSKVFTRPLSGLLAVVLALALAGFADASSRWNRVFMAVTHWLAHVVAAVTAMWAAVWCATALWNLCATCPTSLGRSAAALVTMGVLTFLFGLAIGGLVFGAYLWISERTGRHANDAFAALHMTGYKNFLRLRLSDDGTLTVYPFGIRDVKDWMPRTNDDDGETALTPPGPPAVELIEPPIRIGGPPSHPQTSMAAP